MKDALIRFFSFLLHRYHLYLARRRSLPTNRALLQGLGPVALSREEMRAVRALWGRVARIDWNGVKIYKALNGFDPRYLPIGAVYTLVERSLNPRRLVWFASNKSLYPVLYAGLPQPRCYVRRVNGTCFGGNGPLHEEDAIRRLASGGENEYVFKSGSRTCRGLGVRKLDLQGLSETERYGRVKEMFGVYGSDFVVQENVRQHPDTERFNESSLNTFRLTTLFINGRCTLCSSVLKIGAAGSFIDDPSAGGVGVAVDAQGRLSGFGFKGNGQCVTASDNGTPFAGHTVRDYPELLRLSLESHPALFPSFGLVGWDWAIDREGRPLFIEANLWRPSIFTQACTGPLFGDRTEEVIDYVERHPVRLLRMNA